MNLHALYKFIILKAIKLISLPNMKKRGPNFAFTVTVVLAKNHHDRFGQ